MVHRVREDPRVTLPYTPEQWARIDELGEEIDQRLDAGDVRLTMGGEPTFVSIDDMEGAEWNTAADGEAKRALALDLTLRLRQRFATGGLIQHGQGKWYPGEPLPRWQLGIVWRDDGEPLWRRDDLLADPAKPGTSTIDDARLVADGIAARFGIDPAFVSAAYEDPVDQAWREARLPAGDPPTLDVDDDDDVTDPDARTRLIERLGGPIADPVGFVMPLHPTPDGTGWGTTTWNLRRDRLYLTPGDSPIGLRLPLDSLTWWPLARRVRALTVRAAWRPSTGGDPAGGTGGRRRAARMLHRPRSRWSRATATSGCSSRRSNAPRMSSSCWPSSSRWPTNSSARSSSRATRCRATHG